MSGQLQLVYVHGFNSSPKSRKATLLAEAASQRGMADSYHVPQLPFSPAGAMEVLDQTLQELGPENVRLVGSSMGGFYSIFLCHRYDTRAVLVNPAVKPHLLFRDYLGTLTNEYTGEVYEFTSRDVEVLEKLSIPEIACPERFLTLLQRRDETLDYRQAAGLLQETSISIQRDGSHGFDHFEDFIPWVFRFLGFEDQ